MSAFNQSTVNSGADPTYSVAIRKDHDFLQISDQKSGMTIQGMCKFKKEFESLYPLLRGLSEAGKPRNLSLQFSENDKSAHFYYPESCASEIAAYFNKLFILLRNEIKFKSILKKVIINRDRFKAEQMQLHSSLINELEY